MKRRKNNRRKPKINKETEAEDWCFECKDGGELIICDYGDCLKVYHPSCVGGDDSFLKTGKRWTCGLHSCFKCHKSPKFRCFCCPKAICTRCLNADEFAPVSGKNGFCNECLTLVLLAEENVEYDCDGDKIDFKDRNTYECLFKEYWDIIKEIEGLTLDIVYTAQTQLKKSGKYKRQCSGDNELIISDCDVDDIEFKPMYKWRCFKGQEFRGWGSKPLIEFLTSIGKDITKELSQYDVDCIISAYIREKSLLDPEKKKKVLCDDKLYSVFRKKSVSKNQIYNLLGPHLADNLVQSEDEIEDEDKSSSRDKNENVTVAYKKQRTLTSDRKSQEQEVECIFQQTGYASIVADNIKLIYLRRSLVDELLKHRDSFEGKVVGSFVRIKTDPRDYLQKNSHQLLQVTGIKITSSANEIDSKVLLQASRIPSDIHISMLSDSDFTEEECEDLRQKVKSGLLKKPTVMELEQKARSLHVDIMKPWIERELATLQSRIDHSNEKGWRRELSQYLDQRELLQKPSEQERLLKQVPKVVAEVVELKVAPGDSEFDKHSSPGSPQSILVWNPKTPST